MNTWDNIKAAQIAHDLVHQESSTGQIADFDLSYILYITLGIAKRGLETTETS